MAKDIQPDDRMEIIVSKWRIRYWNSFKALLTLQLTDSWHVTEKNGKYDHALCVVIRVAGYHLQTFVPHIVSILLASIGDVMDEEERFAHASRNQTTSDASGLEESKDNNVSQLILSF